MGAGNVCVIQQEWCCPFKTTCEGKHTEVLKAGKQTGAGGSFCPSQAHSCSVPKKHTEAYVNYQLFGLLAQTYY